MTATNLRDAPRWVSNVEASGSHAREFNAPMTRPTHVVIFHNDTPHHICGRVYLQGPCFASPSETVRRFRYRVLFRFTDQCRFHKVSSVMVHYICIGWPLMFLWLVVRFPSRPLQQHSLSVCCCCVLFVAVVVCPTALRDGRIFGISIIIGL